MRLRQYCAGHFRGKGTLAGQVYPGCRSLDDGAPLRCERRPVLGQRGGQLRLRGLPCDEHDVPARPAVRLRDGCHGRGVHAGAIEAGGVPPVYQDWNNNYKDEPDKCINVHCSNYPACAFENKPEIGNLDILATTLGTEVSFGALKGRVKAGAMTYLKVSTDDRRGVIKCYLGEGAFLDDEAADLWRRCGVRSAGLEPPDALPDKRMALSTMSRLHRRSAPIFWKSRWAIIWAGRSTATADIVTSRYRKSRGCQPRLFHIARRNPIL